MALCHKHQSPSRRKLQGKHLHDLRTWHTGWHRGQSVEQREARNVGCVWLHRGGGAAPAPRMGVCVTGQANVTDRHVLAHTNHHHAAEKTLPTSTAERREAEQPSVPPCMSTQTGVQVRRGSRVGNKMAAGHKHSVTE